MTPSATAFIDDVRQDPDAAARSLLAEDETAAESLVQALERRLSAKPLERFERVWDLSSAQAAGVFGISRQAYAKWHSNGIPADRRADVGELDAATAELLAHLKVDRIPAAVRRPAPALGGVSLIELASRDPAAAHTAVVEVFDLRRVQP